MNVDVVGAELWWKESKVSDMAMGHTLDLTGPGSDIFTARVDGKVVHIFELGAQPTAFFELRAAHLNTPAHQEL